MPWIGYGGCSKKAVASTASTSFVSLFVFHISTCSPIVINYAIAHIAERYLLNNTLCNLVCSFVSHHSMSARGGCVRGAGGAVGRYGLGHPICQNVASLFLCHY